MRREDGVGPRCGRAQSSQKAVSVEARIVSLDSWARPAKDEVRRESDGLARIAARKPSVKPRRQKETDGWQCLAAVACVCCVQAERAAAAVVRRAGTDVGERTMYCVVGGKGKLGPRWSGELMY